MKYKHIQIDSYNPEWPKMFAEESQIIKDALGDSCITVHHVGSTSVPNLSAKPTIDIITVIKDRKNAVANLETAGYQYRGEYNIPLRLFFNKKTPRDINLHVYEQDHPDIELNLFFRDYLRSHPESVKQYMELKTELLTKQSSFFKNNSQYSGYNLGKDAFIRDILNKTGFSRLRMMCCTHYEEWNAAKRLRAEFYQANALNDTYNWILENREHIHVVLYKGTEIIGYAQVNLLPKNIASIAIIAIDKSLQTHNQEYDKKFILFIERWLAALGYNHKI